MQHLYLTFTALVLATLFALPLGIWISFKPRVSNFFLYVAGLLQTIPSIALLAIMIPLFGIGSPPAIVALFLYAILPILRNTVTGLRNVDPLLREVSESLGMSKTQALRFVDLPLASPSILAGIRIAAVINVGTATLAAFIGAGGLGEYIVTGLALNNTQMIMKGAIPAAVLALLIELVFELIERKLMPAHLRKR
ncbi:MAG: ABC transporter permease [Bacteroidota bacterium]